MLMRRLVVAVGVVTVLLIGGRTPLLASPGNDEFVGFLRQLTAPAIAYWSHDGWLQWHPQRGDGILAATGTQCFFCKGNLIDGDGDGVIDIRDRCLGTPINTPVDERGCAVAQTEQSGWQEITEAEAPALAPGDADLDGVLDDRDRCPRSPVGVKVDADGCWEISPVRFKTRDWRILPVAAETLLEVAAVLEKHPDIRLSIQGHADKRATSSDPWNQRLGEQRSNTVFDYLVVHGANPALLSTISFGYHRPTADNDTPEGRQLNRRVELKVVR